MKKHIILITTITEFILKDKKRLSDFKQCFEINVANPHVDRLVYFFCSNKKRDSLTPEVMWLNHPKVEVVYKQSGIPTFEILFSYANKHYSGNYIVVHNADIFYPEDSQLERIKEIPDNKTMWVLHRYNYIPLVNRYLLQGHYLKKTDSNGISAAHRLSPYKYGAETYPENLSMEEFENDYIKKLSKAESKNYTLDDLNRFSTLGGWKTADSYIFLAPIKKPEIFNFQIGTMGCDSRLMILAPLNGIRIGNPALTIKSYHLHTSVPIYKNSRTLQKVPVHYVVDPVKLEDMKYVTKSRIFRIIFGTLIKKIILFLNPFIVCKRVVKKTLREFKKINRKNITYILNPFVICKRVIKKILCELKVIFF